MTDLIDRATETDDEAPRTRLQEFREDPIVRSKQPGASQDEVEAGEDAMEELNRLSSSFILRRTQDIISKYLPPKTEFVVFCRPTPMQQYLYRMLLGEVGWQELGMDGTCVLNR